MSGRLFVTGGADRRVKVWEQVNGMSKLLLFNNNFICMHPLLLFSLEIRGTVDLVSIVHNTLFTFFCLHSNLVAHQARAYHWFP